VGEGKNGEEKRWGGKRWGEMGGDGKGEGGEQ